MKLLTLHNQKLLKSQDYNYISVGLHLLPYNLADSNYNLCTHSTKSCRESCLNFSGKGGLTKVQESRKKKTLYYLHDRISFLNHLSAEIYYYKTVAQFSNKNLSIRLNLTSDVDWQQEYINGQTLFEIHSDVTFYYN
jgi:hypothetical protein